VIIHFKPKGLYTRLNNTGARSGFKDYKNFKDFIVLINNKLLEDLGVF